MSPETVFYLIHLPIIPAWLMLGFAPAWRWTDFYAHSIVVPIVLGLSYLWFLIQGLMGASAPGAGFSDLASVMAIFDHPTGALIGWSHYLVFDLFVGAWVARDALRRGIGKWPVLPCIFFCGMFGPLGLVLYLGLRFAMGRGGWSLHEQGA